MKNKKFSEKQRFNDKLVFIFLWIGIGGALFGLAKSFINGELTLLSTITYLSIAAGLGFVFWWLKRLQLKISVNDKRIKYKMSPIHNKSQRIAWDEVASCEILRTPLAAQWHGSNIRYGGESWFSLTGRNGLSIETKDGRRFFIGCRNVDELATALDGFPLVNRD